MRARGGLFTVKLFPILERKAQPYLSILDQNRYDLSLSLSLLVIDVSKGVSKTFWSWVELIVYRFNWEVSETERRNGAIDVI